MKFIWTGWYDSYDSLTRPVLMDGDKQVWSGGFYYSSDMSEKLQKLREELQTAAKKFNVEGYDFSSNDTSRWNIENKRKVD